MNSRHPFILKFINVIAFMAILLYPQVSFSSNAQSKLLGVWKQSYPNGVLARTIEFRRDGSYIMMDGRWSTTDRVTVLKYKMAGLNKFELNGQKPNGPFYTNYKNVPVTYTVKKSRLTIKNFIDGEDRYTRLNAKDFKIYNEVLTLFSKGLQSADKTHQDKVGDKTVEIIKPKPQGKILAIMPKIYYVNKKKHVSPKLKVFYLDIKGEKVLAAMDTLNDVGLDFKVGEVIGWADGYEYPERSVASMSASYPKYNASRFLDIRKIQILDAHTIKVQ